MKLGPRRNYHEGWTALRHYANQSSADGAVYSSGPGVGRYIRLGDRWWHRACFSCSSCAQPLADTGFSVEGDSLACVRCVDV